jgi:hypothetical protein
MIQHRSDERAGNKERGVVNGALECRRKNRPSKPEPLLCGHTTPTSCQKPFFEPSLGVVTTYARCDGLPLMVFSPLLIGRMIAADAIPRTRQRRRDGQKRVAVAQAVCLPFGTDPKRNRPPSNHLLTGTPDALGFASV